MDSKKRKIKKDNSLELIIPIINITYDIKKYIN